MLVAVGNALKSTEAFLQGLQRSTGAEDVAWSTTGGRPDALVMFSRSGESAVLTNEEAHQYRRVIDELYEGPTASRKAAVSKKTVEIAVQVAVLSVLRDPHAKAARPDQAAQSPRQAGLRIFVAEASGSRHSCREDQNPDQCETPQRGWDLARLRRRSPLSQRCAHQA